MRTQLTLAFAILLVIGYGLTKVGKTENAFPTQQTAPLPSFSKTVATPEQDVVCVDGTCYPAQNANVNKNVSTGGYQVQNANVNKNVSTGGYQVQSSSRISEVVCVDGMCYPAKGSAQNSEVVCVDGTCYPVQSTTVYEPVQSSSVYYTTYRTSQSSSVSYGCTGNSYRTTFVRGQPVRNLVKVWRVRQPVRTFFRRVFRR
ncbi:MAG: hypothetical protein KatS3mg087_1386 [Patescibacteria group bacterium]|nr:MAG: hypothetical protein KatS3mg087_1386 [Patescibacteria group bacterium]